MTNSSSMMFKSTITEFEILEPDESDCYKYLWNPKKIENSVAIKLVDNLQEPASDRRC